MNRATFPSSSNVLDSRPVEKTFRGKQKTKKLSTMKKSVVEARQSSIAVEPPEGDAALDVAVGAFLMTLRTFQNRLFEENPTKAGAKRRYVCGFHEVSKLLKSDDLKIVVMARNTESFEKMGEEQCDRLTESIENVKAMCCEREIPLVMACTKRRLGKLMKKTSPVSVIGVLRPDGAETSLRAVLDLICDKRSFSESED